MDELEISGKRYISTRRAAKEHKYNSDYIGQLIRARKVPGQKVGRAWYVDADALTAYFNGEDVMVNDAKGVAVLVTAEEAGSEAVPVEESPVYIEESVVQSVEDTIESATEVPTTDYIDPIEAVQPLEVVPIEPEIRELKVRVSAEIEERPSLEPEVPKGGLTYIVDESQLIPNLIKQRRDPIERMEIAHSTSILAPSTKQFRQKGSLFVMAIPLLAVVVLGAVVSLAVAAVGAQSVVTVRAGAPTNTATVFHAHNFASFIQSVKQSK